MVTLVLVLLLVGYFGSLWLKHKVSDAIDTELAEAGIVNVSFEGVRLRWLGADVRSPRFDVERNRQRQRFSLTGISIKSSLASIQQRRIQRLSAEELTVVVEKVIVAGRTALQTSDESAKLKVAALPIPSDLFLLLPIDSVNIHQYTVQHADDQWRVRSDQGLSITQDLLLTNFSFFYPELPEIKVKLQLNAKNQITIDIEPSLLNTTLSVPPILMRLESQISGHYTLLSTSLSIDVDIKESINHSAFVQEHIDRIMGKGVFVPKGSLQVSADVEVNIEELLNMKGLLGIKADKISDVMVLVQGKGVLQLNDINIVAQGRSLSGLNGVLNFDVDGSQLAFSTESIAIKRATAGINVDAIDSAFSGVLDIKRQSYQLNVAFVDGNVLGGDMSLLPFSVSGPMLNSEFEMQLNNVDLRQLLKLQSNQDLSGEGMLSGFIQVSIKNSVVEIHDGHFGSEGGHIRYRRTSVTDAVSNSSGQQQLAFVIDAMENFQYTSLETDVTLKAPDNLHLAIALKGSNPNVEQGQMLHLNLNLEQNVGPLIQAANIDSALQNNLLKQYQNK